MPGIILAAQCLNEVRNRRILKALDDELFEMFTTQVCRWQHHFFLPDREELGDITTSAGYNDDEDYGGVAIAGPESLTVLVQVWKDERTFLFLTSLLGPSKCDRSYPISGDYRFGKRSEGSDI